MATSFDELKAKGLWDYENDRPRVFPSWINSDSEAQIYLRTQQEAAEKDKASSKSVNGWTPPTYYDMASNETRVATQADLDMLMAIQSAYWDVGHMVRKIIEREDSLKAQIDRLRNGGE